MENSFRLAGQAKGHHSPFYKLVAFYIKLTTICINISRPQ